MCCYVYFIDSLWLKLPQLYLSLLLRVYKAKVVCFVFRWIQLFIYTLFHSKQTKNKKISSRANTERENIYYINGRPSRIFRNLVSVRILWVQNQWHGEYQQKNYAKKEWAWTRNRLEMLLLPKENKKRKLTIIELLDERDCCLFVLGEGMACWAIQMLVLQHLTQ